jgi:hypothetical protein
LADFITDSTLLLLFIYFYNEINKFSRKRLSREDNQTSLQYNNLREDSITSIRAEEAIENLIPVESDY